MQNQLSNEQVVDSTVKKTQDSEFAYYKVRLYPTYKQDYLLNEFVRHGRFAYNKFLEEQIFDFDDYKEELESRLIWGEANSLEEAELLCVRPHINRYTFSYRVKTLRQLYPFLKDTPHIVLQARALDLASTFLKFLDKQIGFPKFRNRWEHNSIRFEQRIKLDAAHHRIRLTKLGFIKYKDPREIKGEIKRVTVVKEADAWYACIVTKNSASPKLSLDERLSKVDFNSVIGIDMGVVHFASLSDGRFFELPFDFREFIERIRVLQQELSTKKKGSHAYNLVLAKLHKERKFQHNCLSNFAHQLSSMLVKQYDIIVVEDLKVRSMIKSASGTIENPGTNVVQKRGVNRSISHQGWGMFFEMLEYKMQRKGGIFIKVPSNNTSNTCNDCNCTDRFARISQSEFWCPNCGHRANADTNAACNIRDKGLEMLFDLVNQTELKIQVGLKLYGAGLWL